MLRARLRLRPSLGLELRLLGLAFERAAPATPGWEAGHAPLRRVREKALAPVGRIRSIVVDAVLAVDFLVSSTQAAQHVAAAKHRLLTDRRPTTSFGFCGGFCALMGDKPSCAADKQVGQRASQGDAGGQDEHALAAGTLHRALDAVHGGKQRTGRLAPLEKHLKRFSSARY